MNKNETRNSIKAKLQLMISFAEATAGLKQQIIDAFADSADDEIFDLLDDIQSYESTDIDNIMGNLEDYFKESETKEGQPIAIPYVSLGGFMYSIEAGIQYPNGEKLSTFLAESDAETFQAGSVFYTADATPIDLTMAEIKKGNLAEISNLLEDNQDIDLYVWSSVTTEDYTHSFRLKHADIMQAFDETQEGGEDNE